MILIIKGKSPFKFLSIQLQSTQLQKKHPNMGQSLQKPGRDQEKKDIGPIIESCYKKYFEDADPSKEWNVAEFYHAVSLTIEEINKVLGSTQFRVPKKATLEHAYKIASGDIIIMQTLMRTMDGKFPELQNHHKGKGKSLTKEEFQTILQDVILDTGVGGMGMRDIILYVFGIPLIAVFIKQRTLPNAIPNDVFIPGVTSGTVYLLAKLNKI